MLLAQRARLTARAATRRSLSTLLVAEHNGITLSESTLAAVTACKDLGPTTVLVAGADDCKAAAESAAAVAGVDAVATISHASLAHGVAESWTPLVLALQKSGGHSHVVGASSSFIKGLLPRVAAHLDVAQISDVTDVHDASTYVRPIYAGNAMATVVSSDDVKVITFRPTSFEKAAATGGSASATAVEGVDLGGASGAEWLSEDKAQSDRPELGAAKTVISGGRGLKTAENFAMLDTIADKMGAAVGASRAAVDSGMCPNDMQVGQTGKVVAPDLYVAVGISGAIQHLAGMKDSKTIVAINKDPEAPIFQVADYGLVEDLFAAVPKLESMVEQK
jgi:electron transfer flavoprotein alpha subunit|tara:strand:- start:462 stop:1466 length:1005 start_codon:yes stop_codon:yes gene_type:complete